MQTISGHTCHCRPSSKVAMYPQGPLWASPSFSIWEQQQALQFDPSLFATNMPPCSDLILFTLLHPVFTVFNDAKIMLDDQDVCLLKELQMRMPQNWDTELNKCKEFQKILVKHIKDIVLSPAHVGGTT